jgi:hypothetical protein
MAFFTAFFTAFLTAFFTQPRELVEKDSAHAEALRLGWAV